MRSSWLLLKVFRRRIGICLFIETIVVFLIALDEIRPHNPQSIHDGIRAACIFATALSFCLWFQTRCNTLPFPVTVRQRVWLPMLIVAILWMSGCLAIVLALLCLGVGPLRMSRLFSRRSPDCLSIS